ncbi:MAG: hypothetical protein A3F90_12470 [Deltaproteobacteria bacterium RIFCSPLOWO2_12_FULL_60_19]|nr:MAG: hypothetical protein A3F90_12470 [Deltaproteobacteria bacterium RIFCSPLOWO2_12_FULL_60_19]
MKPLAKGLVIAVVHVAIVASLGAKLLYDRSTQPRVWALAAPYDPNLPIRGRYVRVQLVVEPRGIQETKPAPGQPLPKSVTLRVEADRLVAEPNPQERGYDPSALHVQFIQRRGETLAVLDRPVAFFIPEHIPDPSIRQPDEELWVEVTIPKKGPPRPIRLGVKKGDGPITPLEIE